MILRTKRCDCDSEARLKLHTGPTLARKREWSANQKLMAMRKWNIEPSLDKVWENLM